MTMTNGPFAKCKDCGGGYHHSPVIQHVCDEDTRDATPEEETMISEITRLRTALTASLAREAAAYEMAAKLCEEHARHEVGRESAMLKSHAAYFRALTPADAQAALQSMIDAAVKEAREKDANNLHDAVRLIVALMTVARDNTDFKGRGKLLAWGDNVLAKIGGAL